MDDPGKALRLAYYLRQSNRIRQEQALRIERLETAITDATNELNLALLHDDKWGRTKRAYNMLMETLNDADRN